MNKEEMMSQIAKMECEIKKLKEELNKQEEPNRRWKPVFGERYWFIDGNTFYTDWDEAVIDNDRYKLGNVFKTEEEAKFAVEQLKILAELKEYAYDDKWNKGNNYYYIVFCYTSMNIEIYRAKYLKESISYFSSAEQARKAINAIGEERLKKYYFCVEE